MIQDKKKGFEVHSIKRAEIKQKNKHDNFYQL